jgi:hypothetical protein
MIFYTVFCNLVESDATRCTDALMAEQRSTAGTATEACCGLRGIGSGGVAGPTVLTYICTGTVLVLVPVQYRYTAGWLLLVFAVLLLQRGSSLHTCAGVSSRSRCFFNFYPCFCLLLSKKPLPGWLVLPVTGITSTGTSTISQ